ncbi:MAG TPA: acetoacetate decarboxylase family protein [Candidatus Binatia bacterium]|jgi:acetoacetate decarboxylase
MSKLRYVKTAGQIAKARQNNQEFLESTVRSLRFVYETDAEIAAALVPQPLVVDPSNQVCVTFSHVAIHISKDFTFEIGSAIFGVKATYEGVGGIYLVTMPMTTEQAVVPGRETFGEPKKIAAIDFKKDGDRVSCDVTRMGFTYLEGKGRIGADLGAREFTEYGFCYKALPACEKSRAFDVEPLLVRLEWRHRHTAVHRLEDAELNLYDSMFDPVADVPVRRLVTAEYEEGSAESNGRVLRSVPGAWLEPFLHQRYDDTSGDGIEL